MSDLIGVWVGAILTLLVFSYLLGDSPLFRIAQAIFVGVAVGYAVNVALYLILLPRLIYPLIDSPQQNWHLFVPLALGILLFAKLRAAWSPLGNISIAFLFGVGGALAIGGALSGAFVPQLNATILSLSPAQNLNSVISNWLLVIGTIGALLSFRFLAQPQRPLARAFETLARGWGGLGRWFILIAFGAIFADTAVARVSVLIDRVYYLLHDWLQIVR
ncbi:MAG: hypothetical protein HY070_10760 [Chloroflexi bacterium]|nr:hypothetical protein [Chloroflexota bacterium]MBI3741569.1 hypothetical protein [Chloroflexota bacterium]